MTTKEKIIRKALTSVREELIKIDSFLNANPLSEIIRLDIETIKIAKNMNIPKMGFYLERQMKKRKTLLLLAKRQIKESSVMIDRKVKLGIEEGDLINELFWIEQRSNKSVQRMR